MITSKLADIVSRIAAPLAASVSKNREQKSAPFASKAADDGKRLQVVIAAALVLSGGAQRWAVGMPPALTIMSVVIFGLLLVLSGGCSRRR